MVFEQPLLLNWRRILETCCCGGDPRPAACGEPSAGMQLLELVASPASSTNIRMSSPAACTACSHCARAGPRPEADPDGRTFRRAGRADAREMNLELLRIWKESQKTIIFVTHGISEAVFLGTRVVVLTAGPARMAVTSPSSCGIRHTRHETDKDFGDYTRHIYKLLGME